MPTLSACLFACSILLAIETHLPVIIIWAPAFQRSSVFGTDYVLFSSLCYHFCFKQVNTHA